MYTKLISTSYLDQDAPTSAVPQPPIRSVTIEGSKNGRSVPNYMKKLAAGEDASSPYTLDLLSVRRTLLGHLDTTEERRQYASNSSSYSVTIPASRLEWSGFPERLANSLTNLGAPIIKHDALVTPEMDVEVRTRLLNRLREEYEAMQGQTLLWELRETLHMITRPAEAIRRLTFEKLLPGIIVSQKRARSRRGLAVVRNLSARQKANVAANEFKNAFAGTYLEYVFGVVPLVNDCKDIVSTTLQAVLEANGQGLKTIKARSRANIVRNPVYNGPGSLRTNNLLNTVDLRTTYGKRSVSDVIERLGLQQEYIAPSQTMERALGLYGFTFDSVVPSAWEAFPFSWLVDYFVNVGDIVNALFTSTAGVRWANRSVRSQTDLTITGEWLLRRPYTTPSRYVNVAFKATPSYRAFQHLTVQRQLINISTMNLLPVSFSIPGAGDSKWYNVAAVLSQFVKPPANIRF